MRGHCYDALVGVAGCDKSLPGMMMAMLRLNVPSVFLYGGSILPGQLQGQRRHRASTCSRASAALGRQDVADEDLCELEKRRLPVRRRLRRPVHRQHHGLRVRGHRPGAAAARPRCRRPTRAATQYAVAARRGGDAADRARTSARATSAPARRSRTPRVVVAATGGSTNGGAAPAGHGARVRHRVRPCATSPRSSSARPTSPT